MNDLFLGFTLGALVFTQTGREFADKMSAVAVENMKKALKIETKKEKGGKQDEVQN